MIKLPDEFVPIKYNGYFWNTKTQKLYSIKSGTLKYLYLNTHRSRISYGEKSDVPPHYRISNLGKRVCIYESYLKSLKLTDEVHIIPYSY